MKYLLLLMYGVTMKIVAHCCFEIMFYVKPQNNISKARSLHLATQPLRDKVYVFYTLFGACPRTGSRRENLTPRSVASLLRQLLLPNFLRLYSEEWQDHRRHYAPFNCFRRLMRRSFVDSLHCRSNSPNCELIYTKK